MRNHMMSFCPEVDYKREEQSLTSQNTSSIEGDQASTTNVKEEKVKVLTVTVIRATGVSVGGFLGDWETPDPYVMLRVRTSPNSKQRTSTKGDEVNPEWNEDFKFYLNPTKKNTLEIIMMDEDLGFDDTVGRTDLEVDHLLANTKMITKVAVSEKTTLEISLLVTYDETKELRLSYDLCDEEKQFLEKRREEILKRIPMLDHLNQVPSSVNEVPTIAIMGSGGGYRAACGLSGVFCALQEEGILDCATYVTGLSGSSWYISCLYQREGWPWKLSCSEMAEDLKERFNSDVLDHFHVFDFAKRLKRKRETGQLVRFTDVFGMAIGDALLPNQESKMSHQKYKLKYGEVPLPITTGIRVRKDLPAAEFNEWVEFSPFEYGIAKYGVFGKTNEFGGKYFKGQLIKKFEESPLHYLQGIWGSAFSIILNSWKDDHKKSEEEAKQELKQMVLEEGDQLKNEQDDSDDEEDEVEDSHWITEMLKPSNLFSSRRGKAAETFNFFRGLQFKGKNDADFNNAAGKEKTMCIVDSGIAFNSPYPALLRAERKVELILSFDFSQRGGDNEPPFEELLKAEQWAKDNGLSFPQIKGNPVIEDPNIRECYIFEDKADITCPTILHFPLVNKTFRSYLKPGVPRVTQEDKDFASFDIFDDHDQPYSSFKFSYEEKTFNRLHELMKFNTLLNMDLIKENIAYQVQSRKNNPQFAGL